MRLMARILLALPLRGFDTTEVAVPWHVLTAAGHEVVFATEQGGETPACDPRLLAGVLFGKLGANEEAKRHYARMIETPAFQRPLGFAAVTVESFDGLLLPGGHDKGMRPYLESTRLFEKVRTFFDRDLPVGAICHGPIVLARTLRADGKSVLHGRRTTCLPKYLERIAYFTTAWKLGDYYRTYPEYVEDEVRRALAQPADFCRGPFETSARDTETNQSVSFVVDDGAYVSARWPGDAFGFANAFLAKL